jgi:hypothetical protein
MAKQVFETPDLLRMIYSFGDPTHRELTRMLEQELEAKERPFEKYMTLEPYIPMETLLHQTSTLELMVYLSNFNRCFCCARHSNQKPNWSNKTIVITGPCVFESKKNDCECNCRHLSRVFVHKLKSRMNIE